MSVFNLDAYPVVHDRRIDLKLGVNAVGQRLRVARFKQNYIASDLASQSFGSAKSHKVAFVQNREAAATFGFFHQVGGHDDRDPLLIAEDLKILPKVAPGAGIEAGGGLVQKKNLRMVE